MTTPFAEKLLSVVESGLLKVLKDGSWLAIDYNHRVKVDVSFLDQVFRGLDMEKVRGLVKDRLENYIADKIFNSMSTEVSTDVKRILADVKLREDVRDMLKAKIQEAAKGLS